MSTEVLITKIYRGVHMLFEVGIYQKGKFECNQSGSQSPSKSHPDNM